MKWRTGVLIAVAALVAALLAGWELIPRVEAVQPPAGEIRGHQALEMTFSRSMDPDSVEEYLTLTPQIDGSFTWDEKHRSLSFTPDKVWPSGEEISLGLGRGPRSCLHLPLLGEVNASWQVSPPFLIYLWPANNISNLYQANPESGETQALTNLTYGVLDYSIAPDREQVYFSTPEENGTSLIMILDLETGQTTQVLNCLDRLCTNPQPSPDGKWLAFETVPRQPGLAPGVQLLNLQDQSIRDLGEPTEHLEQPLWSSSGWLSYYNQTLQGYQIWNPLSDQILFLANDTGGDGSWSADGRYFLSTEIVFVGDTLAPRHLMLFDMVNKNTRDLSGGSFLEDLNPSFSPQGEQFAFSRKSLDPREWTPGRQLWVMDLESGEAAPLTDEVDYQHTSFAWHPNGRQLAYVRYNQAALSQPPEIWMISINGEDPLRLIINGFAPGWIP